MGNHTTKLHLNMVPKHILLLGGHGKVSLFLTPLLVAQSHRLTSVIRNPDQKATILKAGSKGPGQVDVLVESLDDVKSESDAKKILDKVKPDWVVWSAGKVFAALYSTSQEARLTSLHSQEPVVKAAKSAHTPSTSTLALRSSVPRSLVQASANSSSCPRLTNDVTRHLGGTRQGGRALLT